jgi:hypothetical protein
LISSLVCRDFKENQTWPARSTLGGFDATENLQKEGYTNKGMLEERGK